MTDRNRLPVLYKPERRAHGYAVAFAYYDETDTRRRSRGYGETPAAARADAARRWHEAVELVRDIRAGRRTRQTASGPMTLRELACDALPALAGAQKPRQLDSTARYLARYWCGWCPTCRSTTADAYRWTSGQSGRSVEAVGAGRCRCGGALLGERPIADITTADVNGLLAAALTCDRPGAKGPIKPATVNRIRAAGSVAFRHAVEGRRLDRSPVEFSRRQREGRKVISVPSGADIAALLGGVDRQWAPMVASMALGGLRLGEAQALRHADVELHRGRIVVRRSRAGETKSGHHRIVPIVSSVLADALELAAADRPDGLVAGGVEPHGAIRRAAMGAGIPVPNRHRLRHFFTSAVLALGAPVPLVKSWMGHSTIEVTDGYAHLLTPSPELRALFDRIGPYVGRP